MTELKYCIDTSAFIKIGRGYSAEFFPDIWINLAKLIDSRRVIAPIEVREELGKCDDEVSVWAKSKKSLFIDVDEEQQDILLDVLDKHPIFANPEKEPPYADPWVVALAIKKNNLYKKGSCKLPCVVITEERLKPNAFKIPNICKSYNIDCFDVFELFRRENLTFKNEN